MKIPPYWAVNKDGPAWVFGWSFESIEDARRDAAERSARAAARIAAHAAGTEQARQYDYLDRPLREEILKRVEHNGEDVAILTRNRYGAVVLNSASVCFVDIDFEPPKPLGLFDRIGLLFSKSRRDRLAARAEAAEQSALDRISQWARLNPERSFRLYRTAAGFRMMLTDRLYDPVSPEVSTLFQELASDPFYRRLTQKQACFRARLSPKPWRCGCPVPPCRYPFQNERAEASYRRWVRDYDEKGEAFSTCRLVKAFGDGPASPQIAEIQRLHDSEACRADRALA